jgi:hypothetical protein
MTSQCPRCGTPRMGDFCHSCGLDFRPGTGQAMPAQQMPPTQTVYGTPQQQAYQTPVYPQTPGYPPQQPTYYQPQTLGGYYPQTPGFQAPSPWAPPPPSVPQPDATPATDASDQQDASVPQPVTAPSVCLRCYAPLHPGYTRCGNCGFDNATAWGAAALAPATGVPVLASALALLGAGLIVAAGVLLFVAQRAG